MGLTLQIIKMIHSVTRDSHFESVVDLGSQDLLCDDEELRLLFSDTICEMELKGSQRSAKIAYDAMGFSSYECIDMDGRHGSHLFDLNFNIHSKYNYYETFDLVYNGGTSEHCFNQWNVFENIHNLCKLEGIMFHVIPINGGVNHGFFNYHPMMFARMAHTNNYTIELAWLYGSDGYCHPCDFNSRRYYEDFKINYENDKANEGVLLCLAFKKNKNAGFVAPYQVSLTDYLDNWTCKIYSKKFVTTYLNALVKENSLKKVAIFGCGKASDFASDFANKAGLSIEVYIDDFKIGSHNGVAIINRLALSMQDIFFDAIVLGPNQKIENVHELSAKFRVIDMSLEIGFNWLL